ncbi:MAG TPA: guanylate kinase [candidate division Zixibacteria bacterium]|nr:guanylate kinase [candidate division Zixibacteria bacterium]
MSSRANGVGKIVIVSSPSGGGKTSITQRLLKKHKQDDWRFSVSVTTRPIRGNERDGREYHFRTSSEFAQMRAAGKFAESCRVHRYLYGTLKSELERTIKSGGVILLDIDVKGAAKIKRAYPQAVSIFILPPSKVELRRRLKARGTETKAQLRTRLENSLAEMKEYRRFDYTVVNDRLDVAAHTVECIIESSHALKKYLDTERIERIIG